MTIPNDMDEVSVDFSAVRDDMPNPAVQRTFDIMDEKDRARAVFNMLEQDEKWIDGEGNVWDIEMMSSQHVGNVITFLQRRVQYLAYYHGLALCEIPFPPDVDSELDQLWERQMKTPEEWLDATPLMKKLLVRDLGKGFAP